LRVNAAQIKAKSGVRKSVRGFARKRRAIQSQERRAQKCARFCARTPRQTRI